MTARSRRMNSRQFHQRCCRMQTPTYRPRTGMAVRWSEYSVYCSRVESNLPGAGRDHRRRRPYRARHWAISRGRWVSASCCLTALDKNRTQALTTVTSRAERLIWGVLSVCRTFPNARRKRATHQGEHEGSCREGGETFGMMSVTGHGKKDGRGRHRRHRRAARLGATSVHGDALRTERSWVPKLPEGWGGGSGKTIG